MRYRTAPTTAGIRSHCFTLVDHKVKKFLLKQKCGEFEIKISQMVLRTHQDFWCLQCAPYLTMAH